MLFVQEKVKWWPSTCADNGWSIYNIWQVEWKRIGRKHACQQTSGPTSQSDLNTPFWNGTCCSQNSLNYPARWARDRCSSWITFHNQTFIQSRAQGNSFTMFGEILTNFHSWKYTSRGARSWSWPHRQSRGYYIFHHGWDWISIMLEPIVSWHISWFWVLKWRGLSSYNERLWYILDTRNMFRPILGLKNSQ